MPLLLCAATAKELLAVWPDLPAHLLVEHQPFAWSSAPSVAAQQPWLVCITGVGPINAGIALGKTLALYPQIKGVFNTGLAGSFDTATAPLGSMVLVKEEICPEYGLLGDNGVDAAALGFPQWKDADRVVTDRLPLCTDPALLALPPLLSSHEESATPVRGSALSVAGVSNSRARATALRVRYGALLENMEGFAVALACARHRVPLLEVRFVSNVVGSRAPEDRKFSMAFTQMTAFFKQYFGQL